MHPEHTSVGDFGQHLEIELKGFGAVSHQGFLNQVIGFLLRVLLVVGLLVSLASGPLLRVPAPAGQTD